MKRETTDNILAVSIILATMGAGIALVAIFYGVIAYAVLTAARWALS